MSKDRQTVKEKKKVANPLSKKAPSDYQSGKSNVVKPIIEAAKKKK
jgi:type III secretion system FlhB-like substrate exporter